MENNQSIIKIKDLNNNIPELSQLIGFFDSNAIRSPEVRKLIKGGPKEKAYLLFFHALENNWLFQTILRNKFKNTNFEVFGNVKTNIVRIEQKIEEEGGNLGKLTDMIRATIVVGDPTQMIIAYDLVSDTNYIQIIRVKN